MLYQRLTCTLLLLVLAVGLLAGAQPQPAAAVEAGQAAAAGALDTTFEGDGMVRTAFGAAAFVQAFAYALAVQPDGKLVAAGLVNEIDPAGRFSRFDIALARYNPDGSLDPGFGQGGLVQGGFGEGGVVSALLLQPDGKLIAGGTFAGGFMLARYNPDGSLDAGFGNQGRVVANGGQPGHALNALLLLPDGKIVAAGSVSNELPGDLLLVRYLPDGQPDSSFGRQGLVITDIDQQDALAALLPLRDGKLLAAGTLARPGPRGDGSDTRSDLLLVRYNQDGSVDHSFGTAGRVVIDLAVSESLQTAIQLPDGRLLAAGMGPDGAFLLRLSAAGQLDPAFGNAGRQLVDVCSGAVIRRLAAQRSGQVVAAGSCQQDFLLLRYEVDGRLDASFGSGGVVRTDLSGAEDPASYGDSIYDLALLPDDRIVAAGAAGRSFGLARYLGQHGQRCFVQTSQCSAGRLGEYWAQHGALPVFGYPTGPAAAELNRDTGQPHLTQWFERNRLELHPAHARPYDVLLGRLGDERLRQLGLDWSALPRDSGRREGCLWFEQTRLNVCDQARGPAGPLGFKRYWETHGLEFDGQPGSSYAESLALFGLPLTQPRMETNSSGDTVLAQWFERARLEWHPGNPDAYQVLLGLLGNETRPR